MDGENNPPLQVTGLKKYFTGNQGILSSVLGRDKKQIPAVDDVSFELQKNEVVGVIGESGCGKTTLLRTLIGLYEPTDGEIRFQGRDTSTFSKADWKQYRRNIQIIFQDPFNSLDPKMTIREILREPLNIHGIDDQETRIPESLEMVELNPPERYLDQYPSQLSGGEKQRVSIARALIMEPDVILADEPASMLDVSTQASILRLLSQLITETGVAMMYISHDLSTVGYVCDEINVMYLGRFVESAPTLDLLDDPKHPYSQALINAIPIPDPSYNRERTQIDSVPPDPSELEEGCRFKDRCPERMDICDTPPAFVDVGQDRNVACHLYYDHNEYMEMDDKLITVRGGSDHE